MNNPLLQLTGLVSYKDVRPEHVTPAVDHWLAAANEALERTVSADVPADYENIV